jgi:hypothetical protein
VSFAAITLCVASQRVFIVVSVYFVIDSVRKLLDTPPYIRGVKIFQYQRIRPVPMAEQSEARTVFGRSNTGIVGSNRTRGIDVCPHFSVLCCPV